MEQPDTGAAGIAVASSFRTRAPGFCRDRTKAGAKGYSLAFEYVDLQTLSLKGQFLLPALGETGKEEKTNTLEGKLSRDKDLDAP